MASVREAGWEAFQQGNIEEAIRLLGLACQEDPTDYEAHLYLGAACGQAERHDDAIAALSKAVRLQPANAQARYNLGVAMEKAGYEEQALEAFRQALQLDGSYHKAAESVTRLSYASAFYSPPASVPASIAAEPPRTQEFAAPAPIAGEGSPVPRSLGFAPVAEDFTAPTQGSAVDPAEAFDLGADPNNSVPSAPEVEIPGYAATAPASPMALPSHGLLSDYTPSPNAPRGPTSVAASYSPELPPPNYDDEIDIPEAIRNFGRILVMPDKFFREQAGKYGLMSPMLMVGIYLVLQLLEVVIRSGAQGIFTLVLGIVFSPISLAVAGMQMLVVYLVSGLLVHFLGWIFGNRKDYSVSVRACVYADAPRFVLTLFGSIYMAFFVLPAIMAHPLMPAEIERAMGLPAGTMAGGYTTTTTSTTGPVVVTTNSSKTPATRPPKSGGSGSPILVTTKPGRSGATPKTSQAWPYPPLPTMVLGLGKLLWNKYGGIMVFWLVVSAIGWLWSNILLVMAIHRLQQIPAAAAAGVVILMYSLGLLLLFIIGLALRGPVTNLIQMLLHTKGMGGAGGAGL